MTGVVTENVFGLSDKQANALLVELVDLSSGVRRPRSNPRLKHPPHRLREACHHRVMILSVEGANC